MVESTLLVVLWGFFTIQTPQRDERSCRHYMGWQDDGRC